MKLDCQFKSLDHSQALVEYAEDRMAKLSKYELKAMSMQIIFSAQRHKKFVEVTITGGTKKFQAKAFTEDFYDSVDKVLHKLTIQMAKSKSRVQKHKKFHRSKEGKLLQLRPDMEFDEGFYVRKAG